MAAERHGRGSACVTDRGRRARNEDAAVAVRLADGSELIAVADGMGGHAAGEVASRRALAALQAALEAGVGLRSAVEHANAAVLEEARVRPECAGMGTTLVALLLRDGEYEIANVGDSRAYRVDEGGVRQLTRDHSFIEDAVRSGQLTQHEAGASPWRNALTRAIGLAPEVEVDCFGPFSAEEPHAVLLCTDGFHRVVADEQLVRTVRQHAEPEDVAQELVTAAHEAGSEDNISLAVLRLGDSRSRPRANAGEHAAPPRRAAPGQKRRRPGHVRRWARIEVAAILLGLCAVILYVLALTWML